MFGVVVVFVVLLCCLSLFGDCTWFVFFFCIVFVLCLFCVCVVLFLAFNYCVCLFCVCFCVCFVFRVAFRFVCVFVLRWDLIVVCFWLRVVSVVVRAACCSFVVLSCLCGVVVVVVFVAVLRLFV